MFNQTLTMIRLQFNPRGKECRLLIVPPNCHEAQPAFSSTPQPFTTHVHNPREGLDVPNRLYISLGFKNSQNPQDQPFYKISAPKASRASLTFHLFSLTSPRHFPSSNPSVKCLKREDSNHLSLVVHPNHLAHD